MDRDLRDDMLKLVRYKILFIKREYEHAFEEDEDLVSENMDGPAFTAWKVAEFIQRLAQEPYKTRIPPAWENKYPSARFRDKNGEFLKGFPDEDKKYLRVFYEVLDRYPREKFKYEERQIEVLEDIRDKIEAKHGGDGGPVTPPAGHVDDNPAEAVKDPYKEIEHRLYLSRDAFQRWRVGFKTHSQQLGKDIAEHFNAHREVGHLKRDAINPADITRVLSQDAPTFERRAFDRFTGKALGDLRIYRTTAQSPTEFVEFPAPPVHSIWGKTREHNGEFRQRITGSNTPGNYVDPDDLDRIWDGLKNVTLDLTYNAHLKDLGTVSWVSFYQNHSNQMRSIGYEVGPYLLWVNQLLNTDMTPTEGPIAVPGDPPIIVKKDQLILSLDWEQDFDGKRFFCVYAMHLNFDFDKGRAEFNGPILKMKNERID